MLELALVANLPILIQVSVLTVLRDLPAPTFLLLLFVASKVSTRHWSLQHVRLVS